MAKNEAPAEDEETVSAWPKIVEWSGRKFSIADPEDWSLGALRAFERGHQIDALARVLGDAAWATIENMPVSQTRPLFDKIAAAAGFTDSGE